MFVPRMRASGADRDDVDRGVPRIDGLLELGHRVADRLWLALGRDVGLLDERLHERAVEHLLEYAAVDPDLERVALGG